MTILGVILILPTFYLFVQITNQLVLACKEYIQEACITDEGEDLLWAKVQHEILNKDTLQNSDPQQKHLQTQLEGKLKVILSRERDRG